MGNDTNQETALFQIDKQNDDDGRIHRSAVAQCTTENTQPREENATKFVSVQCIKRK